MARYRGKKGVEGLLFLIIGGIILAILILKFTITISLLLMPLFILTAFIYYFILEKKNKQKIDEAKISIWYSEQELSELDELSSIISSFRDILWQTRPRHNLEPQVLRSHRVSSSVEGEMYECKVCHKKILLENNMCVNYNSLYIYDLKTFEYVISYYVITTYINRDLLYYFIM
ncbi:MAG: hypothetical protein HRT73_06445 [Flavobacteriales bacterium]|nr:hypothetical protein [Flavobacteriales bacterium]